MDPHKRREILEYEREMMAQARERSLMAGIRGMSGPPAIRPRMDYAVANNKTETKTNKLLLLEGI